LEAKLALEPVSVYISRATQKLYVRRNTHKPWPDGGEVFDATLEVPVTIRNPDKPIGTHVFTAMARNDAGLRWTAVTIDNGDDEPMVGATNKSMAAMSGAWLRRKVRQGWEGGPCRLRRDMPAISVSSFETKVRRRVVICVG
jgi:hypothetical protein